ncbi:MAG: hypothetical protein ABJA67_08225 [Chthonomonadales bacterium]
MCEGIGVSVKLGSITSGWSATIDVRGECATLEIMGPSVLMTITDADICRLTEPETEGIYFQTGDAAPIRYYIEKDFPCIHPSAGKKLEPVTESFPAPDDFEVRKA